MTFESLVAEASRRSAGGRGGVAGTGRWFAWLGDRRQATGDVFSSGVASARGTIVHHAASCTILPEAVHKLLVGKGPRNDVLPMFPGSRSSRAFRGGIACDRCVRQS